MIFAYALKTFCPVYKQLRWNYPEIKPGLSECWDFHDYTCLQFAFESPKPKPKA